MTTMSRFRLLVPAATLCLIAGMAVAPTAPAHAGATGATGAMGATGSAASGGSVSPLVWRPGAAGQTYPVPERVVYGPSSAPAAGAVRLVKVAGVAGVPSGVRAVSVRADVTPATNGGAVFVYTPGAASPAALGWLHVHDPRTFPTRVVPDANGRIAVRVTSKALVTVRVDGYVTNPGKAGPGGVTAVKPVKVLDTAAGIGGGPLAPAAVRTVAVGGRGGVPATGVRAVWVSFGVQTPAASGGLKVWPAGQTAPAVEQLAFTAARNAGNLLLVPVDAQGRFSLSVSRAVASLRATVVAWVAATPEGFNALLDRGHEPVGAPAPTWQSITSGDPAVVAARVTLTGGTTTIPRRSRAVLVYVQVTAGAKAGRVTVGPAKPRSGGSNGFSVTVPARGLLSVAVPVSTDDGGTAVVRYSTTLTRPRLRIGGYVAFNPVDPAPIRWVGSASEGLFAGAGSRPALSEDGRYVAFLSTDPNLVAGDTNGDADVFLRDTVTGSLTRVSVSTAGDQAEAPSHDPSISGDGRFVVFTNSASLLDDPDDRSGGVYLHDMLTGTTVRISDPPGGAPTSPGYILLGEAAISGDGRFVAFESTFRLVPEDVNDPGRDIYVYDRSTGDHELVTVTPGGAARPGYVYGPTISGDGRYVSFVAEDGGLVPGDTNNAPDVFLRDRVAGTTEIVSIADDESPASGPVDDSSTSDDPFGFASSSGGVSDDGRYVAFSSTADNLVPGDLRVLDDGDVFLRDRTAGTTTRASTPLDGSGAGLPTTGIASVSADGRFVAYQSARGNLVEGDGDSYYDVFVFDRVDGTNSLVTMPWDGSAGPASGGRDPMISRDGGRVAFVSESPTFVPGDTANTLDVFVAQRR